MRRQKPEKRAGCDNHRQRNETRMSDFTQMQRRDGDAKDHKCERWRDPFYYPANERFWSL